MYGNPTFEGNLRGLATEHFTILALVRFDMYSFQLGFWNYLDFIMVCGGILDLGLLPLDSRAATQRTRTGTTGTRSRP